MTTVMQQMQHNIYVSENACQQIAVPCTASIFSQISLLSTLSILALSSLCSLAALLPLL